jgi:hypothetical protein
LPKWPKSDYHLLNPLDPLPQNDYFLTQGSIFAPLWIL